MSLILLGILNSQVSGAAAGAYDLLETQVLTSSASSVTFTGLGSYSDYKHLQLRMHTRTDNASTVDYLYVNLNGDTGSNYAKHNLLTSGSSVFSSGSSNYSQMTWLNTQGASASSGVYGPQIVDLLDFSSTSKNKTLRAFAAWTETTPRIEFQSGLWMNTNAVTSITFTPHDGTNIVTGSRFSLYGIKGA